MGGGRAPCCDKNKVKRGPWSPAEDLRLTAFIHSNGHANWRSLPKQAGLLRCGKSCRLRWINYLSPNVKRGNFTPEEEAAIIKLHDSYGNKWSKIAAQLPGRTDNEIKNVWNTHLKKKLTADDHKENNSNIKTKNSSASSSSSQSSSTTNSSVEDKGMITSSDHREVLQAKMPENLTQEDCARNAENVTSRSSSFASNVSNFSTSTHDHVAKANEETESLLLEVEASDNYLEDLSKFDINVDTEFDVWSVLEELEILEAQEKGTTLQSSNGFVDENYIMNHDMELAEKSEWYKYLENNELDLWELLGN